MSPSAPIHAKISGPIVMIGFGSIGKGTLPLIERHFAYDKSRLVIIDPHEDGEIAKAHPDVMIGSYPFQEDGRPNTNLVVRSRDADKLAAAKAAVEAMLARVQAGLRQTA